MSDIVITEFMDEAAIERLRAKYAVRFDPTLVGNRGAMLEAIRGARALIVRNRTLVNAEVLDAASQLAAIGRLGVGLDNIDVKACTARGVRVLPASGANDVAVAEYVIATALLLRRGAYDSRARMIAGSWPRSDLIGHEISNAVLALVGFGGIARQVAHRARCLGMQVLAHDPNIAAEDAVWVSNGVRSVDFNTLLTEADVLSLHVPRVPDTEHLIDADALKHMKETAVIINSARGGVVDDAALADALRERRVAAAALDVFENEPLCAESVYAGLDNVVLTPHIAGVTVESNTRVSEVTVDNVLATLDEVRV